MTRFAAPIAEQIWDMKYRFKEADGTPIFFCVCVCVGPPRRLPARESAVSRSAAPRAHALNSAISRQAAARTRSNLLAPASY